jgi:hypothetical protein
MSRENVELVQRSWAAYAEVGMARVAEFYAAEHVAYAVAEWPDDPKYGPEGLEKLSDQWTENFDEFSFDFHEVRDAGDTVIALLEMTGRIKGSAVPIQQPLGAVHGGFRDGLIGETRYFLSWQEALEAAGLSE